MTVERRMLVGFGDVRAIVLECRSCSARISRALDKAEMPQNCPVCNHGWWQAGKRIIRGDHQPLPELVDNIQQLLAMQDQLGVRVLLEFDAPA